MNEMLSPQELKIAMKQYRSDVRSVGTVSFEKSQALLEEGRICRGWTKVDGRKQYFHIIRSPQNFPEKTFMTARNEKEVFTMTVYLGMQAEIEFDLLVSKDETL